MLCLASTVDERYFYSTSGGSLRMICKDFNLPQKSNPWVDYIWVILRSDKQDPDSKLLLRLEHMAQLGTVLKQIIHSVFLKRKLRTISHRLAGWCGSLLVADVCQPMANRRPSECRVRRAVNNGLHAVTGHE